MNKKLLFSIAASLLTIQAHAYQSTNFDFDIGTMASEANLVFRGTVVEVDYRSSQKQGDQRSLPHTFVTFKIEDVLYGTAPQGEFTIRFLGGQTDNGEVMMVSGTPHFDVGDQDVIFVGDNGVGECPLIECGNGRFRIVNDFVYNDLGQTINQDEKGSLMTGKVADLAELNTFRIGDREYKRQKNRDISPDGGEVSKADIAVSYHMQANSFIDTVRSKIAEALPNDSHGFSKHALNVSKDKPFYAAASKPVSLPEPEPALAGPEYPDRS